MTPTIARSPPRRAATLLLALVADDEACERECDVEGVLAVVIDGIDAEVAGHETGEQLFEMIEGVPQRLHRGVGPGRGEKLFDGSKHRRRGTHLHGIGDIKIAASRARHLLCSCAAGKSRRFIDCHSRHAVGNRPATSSAPDTLRAKVRFF